MDDLDDAIVEDTCHCTVCCASFLLGSHEPYVVLDPPGEPNLEAYRRGCEQVKLCPECARRAWREYGAAIGQRLVWSKDRPTQPGHYWLRIATDPPHVVEVQSLPRGFVDDVHVEFIYGLWAGPIPEPDPE